MRVKRCKRILFLLWYWIMKLWLTLKRLFYTKEKLFKLFYIENNFAKHLFKSFVSQITVIPRKDTFLYYRKNQISFYEILFLRQSKSMVNIWMVTCFVFARRYVRQKQSSGGVLSKKYSKKFRKIHRKTSMSESFLI